MHDNICRPGSTLILSPFHRLLATCSADTTVKIWSIGPSFDFKLEKTLQGHQRWVWDAAFSADSAYLVTGTGLLTSEMIDPTVPCLSWLSLRRVASSDHVARLWELASGETVRQYNGHSKAAVCVALNDINLA